MFLGLLQLQNNFYWFSYAKLVVDKDLEITKEMPLATFNNDAVTERDLVG